MAKAKITEEEKLNLRRNAYLELVRLETLLVDADTIQVVDQFKNLFNICESVYKVVLAEYKKRKEYNYKDNHLKLNMNQIPAALNFAGYSFDKGLLNEIFGSSSEKGNTAKKLRDATTHGFDPKAVEEIMLRKDELFGYMYSFLSEVRTDGEIAA